MVEQPERSAEYTADAPVSDAGHQHVAAFAPGAASSTADRPVDVLLVCSPGGHLLQLVALRPAWEEMERAWVTFDKSDARSLLGSERVFFAHGPTNRNLTNLGRNLVLAWRLIGDLRPRVVLSTGAGLSVPFGWVARLRGARVVYVESLTRIDQPSLSCRLLAPVTDRIYVQWPELRAAVRRGRYVGGIFASR